MHDPPIRVFAVRIVAGPVNHPAFFIISLAGCRTWGCPTGSFVDVPDRTFSELQIFLTLLAGGASLSDDTWRFLSPHPNRFAKPGGGTDPIQYSG